MTTVALYFDLVSPYSYLALELAPAFALEHEIRWRPVPMVYGALLDATGLVGPVESDPKRRYTFRDVQRAARLHGLDLVGPPAHPFRSLEALRLTLTVENPDDRLALARRLARAAWAEKADLTDGETLASLAEETGVDARRLEDRIRDPGVKAALREATEEALAAGVFGVPTFRLGRELFWGHDRLPHLAARLQGRIDPPGEELDAVLSRPRGAERPGAPVDQEARGGDGC